MIFNLKNIFLFVFLGISNVIFCQKTPAETAQKELSAKIEKYKYIDTLSSKDYDKVSITIKEGVTQITDKYGKKNGNGGFSIYIYKTNEEPQKLLKSVHHSVVHYEKQKGQIQNSENIYVTIFYNTEGKPDLAKITEDHYTQDKILSSSLNYINLPESIEEAKKISYTKYYTKEVINNLFEEMKFGF